jgi:quercetin dioxygenase-like cupin family protein
MNRFPLALAFVIVSLGATCASAATYPDSCVVGPTHCKLIKEDAKFRVYDYTAKAGDKVAMHSHPAHVVYVLEGGKTKFTNEDGSVREVDLKAGEAVINPKTVHAVEHMSDVHVIIVEDKQ